MNERDKVNQDQTVSFIKPKSELIKSDDANSVFSHDFETQTWDIKHSSYQFTVKKTEA